MQTFTLTFLAIASSLSFAFSAPTLHERQDPSDAPAALAIVDKLFTDVTQYTAVISKVPTFHFSPKRVLITKQSRP